MSDQASFGVRRSAFAAFLTTALSLPVPIWTSARTVALSAGGHWWNIALAALFNCFAVIPLLLFFALYRDEGTLHVPVRLQRWAMAGAVTLVGLMALLLPNSLRSLTVYATQLRLLNWQDAKGALSLIVHAPVTWAQVTILTSLASNLALILLLVALSLQPSEEPLVEVPISTLLRDVSRIAVLAWGVWIALNLLRVGAVPFTYPTILDQAARMGVRPPGYWDLMWETLRPLLDGFPIYLVSYIVLKRLRAAPASPLEAPEVVPTAT